MAIAMAFFLCPNIQAQDYKSAAGLRLSWGGVGSYKYGLKDQLFAEGIVSFRWGGPTITGLIEHQEATYIIDGLYWFAGGGLHLGLHGRNNVYDPAPGSNDKLQINLGVDLIGGVEYVFPNFPMTVGVDYKPAFSFTGERWFIPEGLGLTARYIFK